MSTTVRHATRQLTALLMLAVPATVGCGGGDPNGSEPPPQGLVAGLDADLAERWMVMHSRCDTTGAQTSAAARRAVAWRAALRGA